jgi:hypothetical protein
MKKRIVSLFAIVIILGLLDLLTTAYILLLGGKELNLFFNWIEDLSTILIVMIMAKVLFYLILWEMIGYCFKLNTAQHFKKNAAFSLIILTLFMGILPIINNSLNIIYFLT